MKKIFCSECGRLLEGTERNCPNCGCKLTVCPECGEISFGNAERCKNCGYFFPVIAISSNGETALETEDKKINDLSKINELFQGDLRLTWKCELPMDNLLTKILKIVSIICSVFGCLWMVISLFVPPIIKSVGSNRIFDIIEMAYKMKYSIIGYCFLLVAGIVCGAVWMIVEKIKFSKWISGYGKAIKEYLSLYANNSFGSDRFKTNCKLAAEGLYFNENKTGMTNLIVGCSICMLVCLVAFVFIGIVSYKILYCYILGVGSDGYYEYMLIVVVLMLIGVIIKILIDKLIEKDQKRWMKELGINC